jgi:hypothetical protein
MRWLNQEEWVVLGSTQVVDFAFPAYAPNAKKLCTSLAYDFICVTFHRPLSRSSLGGNCQTTSNYHAESRSSASTDFLIDPKSVEQSEKLSPL